MFNDLQNPVIVDQLKMTDNKKNKADVKKHEKYPMQRIMSPDRGKKKRVAQGPKPFGILFRINLKGGGVLRLSPDFYNPHGRAQNEYTESSIYHGH